MVHAIHVLYKSGDAFLKEQYNRLNETAKQNNYQGRYENYVKDYEARWTTVADAAVTVLPFIESKFGAYPYKQYSFVHGGDGGMEYPMATLVVSSSLGTAFHEWMHSWYQGVLATNESEYAWMDEGFTTYAESLVSEYYRGVTKSVVEQSVQQALVRARRTSIRTISVPISSTAMIILIRMHMKVISTWRKSRFEEPLTTHADHF